jgi:hypothetical protein
VLSSTFTGADGEIPEQFSIVTKSERRQNRCTFDKQRRPAGLGGTGHDPVSCIETTHLDRERRMPDFEPFDEAIRSDQPGSSFRSLALALAAAGHSKEQVYTAFENYLQHLSRQPSMREVDEDAVLDAMDAVTGWCHRDAALFPD